ncbi:RagB/SusD family nutrient uptake outer membrane protein [Thalassobellus suaedae]|uniref:RagB/SusD family nutrient uptake outer membrane protein n=1 Tax=Thalassobellus suaedae TaxID=3074124 RepID=A0ABY9XZ56_9FLAO|nr:RagB/SusD family nutrient uptake outer membrane protein [Flavobacteriaceae bacterium HL-DH10]
MKLKHILAIIPAILIASCQKDFLEPESLSTFDDNYIYSNVDDARAGVNAVYSQFNEDAFTSRLSSNLTGNTDIETQSGWGNAGDRYQIWDLQASEGNADLDKLWTAAYKAIRDANIAIKGLTNSGNLENTDVSVKNTFNHLLGEAYTIRAYWYSMLIYYFGDVPYSIEAPVAGAEFSLPKTDRNTILANEIQNLINVEENMQWADQLPYGIEQVNREYTLGMIARLSLQRGGYYLTPELNMVRKGDYLDYYTIAKTYSHKLIQLKDRELPTDFRQIFLNQVKFTSPVNEDILFEIPFSINDGDVAWNIGIEVNFDNATHNYGQCSNYMEMPHTYYMSFDSSDIRRDVTCGLFRYDNTLTKHFIDGSGISQAKWDRTKLTTPPGKASTKDTGINWPMMRYADVLLMYAEAENELNGPTIDAKEALKKSSSKSL